MHPDVYNKVGENQQMNETKSKGYALVRDPHQPTNDNEWVHRLTSAALRGRMELRHERGRAPTRTCSAGKFLKNLHRV